MKNYFYFTKTEKQGLIFLATLIIAAIIIGNATELFHRNSIAEQNNKEIKMKYEDFLTHIKENENKHKPTTRSKVNNPLPVLTVFDPNTADSVSFLRLGLPSWMASNILKYRTKGGKFRKAEDFRKIYGLSEEQYLALKPYIKIKEEYIPVTELTDKPVSKNEVTETTPKTFKYPPGTTIDLNSADTTELKKIPGIGTATAKRIINYRNKLGGFYHVDQLTEIDATNFNEWFIIENPQINKINLNKSGVEKLRAHPYINFHQAKAIVEYRKKRGSILNLNQLALLEEFSEKDFERIKHYISF